MTIVELERIRKGKVMALLRCNLDIYLKGLRKTTTNIRVAVFRDYIVTEHLLKTSIRHFYQG
jgi:hypothetical protein